MAQISMKTVLGNDSALCATPEGDDIKITGGLLHKERWIGRYTFYNECFEDAAVRCFAKIAREENTSYTPSP
jgi:hypothetical protein